MRWLSLICWSNMWESNLKNRHYGHGNHFSIWSAFLQLNFPNAFEYMHMPWTIMDRIKVETKLLYILNYDRNLSGLFKLMTYPNSIWIKKQLIWTQFNLTSNLKYSTQPNFNKLKLTLGQSYCMIQNLSIMFFFKYYIFI